MVRKKKSRHTLPKGRRKSSAIAPRKLPPAARSVNRAGPPTDMAGGLIALIALSAQIACASSGRKATFSIKTRVLPGSTVHFRTALQEYGHEFQEHRASPAVFLSGKWTSACLVTTD
jgi:hypothetical protein